MLLNFGTKEQPIRINTFWQCNLWKTTDMMKFDVTTLHFLIFSFQQYSVYWLLRYMHTWLDFEKQIMFWLNIPGFIATNTAGKMS